MTAPGASVIVPVYKGAATIAECVASLLALRFPRERLDDVVVDNASTDRTVELLRGFGAEIRVLFEPKRGAAAARNHGIRAARGGLVAFTDADAVMDAGWLAARLPPLSDPAVGVVGGPVLARGPRNRIEQFEDVLRWYPQAVPSGFWGGRRPSLGGDVTVTGVTDGATAAGGC
jgi:glycosyltransferase involved in cell wall biosynthesis